MFSCLHGAQTNIDGPIMICRYNLHVHKNSADLRREFYRRTLLSANPAQQSCRTGAPVYIGWNYVHPMHKVPPKNVLYIDF